MADGSVVQKHADAGKARGPSAEGDTVAQCASEQTLLGKQRGTGENVLGPQLSE